MTYLLGKVWFVGLLACKVTTRERENELVPYEGPFHGDSLRATLPIFHTPYQQTRVECMCIPYQHVCTNLQRVQTQTLHFCVVIYLVYYHHHIHLVEQDAQLL